MSVWPLYVAVAAIGALIIQTIVTGSALRAMQRQHAREREQLLARIMHLAGRTWEIPPAREHDEELVPPSYSWGDDAPVGN